MAGEQCSIAARIVERETNFAARTGKRCRDAALRRAVARRLGAGQPIGGPAWELAKKMLAAINISAEDAYSASLSCFNSPGVRMTKEQREACAEIARKHIALARPKRLLLLGDGPAQALLGKPLAQARGHVHKIEGVRAVATFHPRQLIQNPQTNPMHGRICCC